MKKKISQAAVSGSVSVLLTVLLLIPVAFGVEHGIIDFNHKKNIVLLCLLLSSFLCQLLLAPQKGGGVSSLISASVTVLLIILLTVSTKNTLFSFKGITPVFAAGYAGTMIGTLFKKNKKPDYKKKTHR